MRRGGRFTRLDRRQVTVPPTVYNRFGTSYTSASGALARVEVERATGAVRVVDAYCTAGFLNESQVLLERLAKAPVRRAELDRTVLEALNGHLCRCTGYYKYREAVRDVILADPGRYLA